MKRIKKLLGYVLTILIVVNVAFYLNIAKVNAASMNIISEEITEKYGVTYSDMEVKIGTSVNKLVNYFNMKPDGVNSKLVTWAVQSGNYAYTTAKLESIATNYEKNHPGWQVICGVNADQWYYGTTKNNQKGGYFFFKNQSYYPFTVDGQNLFTISPLGASGNGVGITNDYNNPIVDVYGSNGIEIQVYDSNDNLIATYPVSGYNKTPGVNETTVWSGRMSNEVQDTFIARDVSSTNDLYVVNRAEIAYMNNSSEYAYEGSIYAAVDSFYGRGIISEITKEITLKSGQFAIETTNTELLEKLGTDVKVVIEQQYASPNSNNLESVSGYHTVHMKNGVINEAGHNSYNDAKKPRSLWGIKEDGSYFLITIGDKGSETSGPVYNDTNEILKYYDAYTAYQHDGGGSVTSIYRNDDGTFNVVDTTDGRGVFSGLFFVVRDPGYTYNRIESTASSITLNKKTSTFAKNITNVTAVVDGKTYQLEGDKVVLDGLKDNTEYDIQINYTYNDKQYSATVYGATKEYNPGLEFTPTHNGFFVTRRSTDEVLKTVAATFTIDGETYQMGDVDSFTITGLLKNTQYEIEYTYIVENQITKEKFTKTKEADTYTTLSYEIPSIVGFAIININGENGKLTVQYEYKDADSLVNKACILVNDSEITLSKKSGIITVEDLNFANNIYKLIVKLEYILPSGAQREVQSEVLIAEYHIHEWEDATCETPKTCKTCGETEGFAKGHDYEKATCETPKTCKVCGKTDGDAQGHMWIDATYSAPKTCIRCNKTEGEPLVKEEKKGCKKSSIATMILSIGLLSSGLYFIRRKK